MSTPDSRTTVTAGQAAPEPCEHHWVSQHKPGHAVYWVRLCGFCGNADWDDLDQEIAKAIAAAAPAPAGEGVLLSDHLRERGRPGVADMIERAERVAAAGDLSTPDPLDGAMVECGASHCPPSMHADCEWPKCATVVMQPQAAPGPCPVAFIPADPDACPCICDLREGHQGKHRCPRCEARWYLASERWPQPQAASDLTARLAAVTALLDASHKRDWDSGLPGERKRVADERAGLGMGALT